MAPDAQPLTTVFRGLAVLASIALPAAAGEEDTERLARTRPLLEEVWPEIGEARSLLPAFLRDTAFALHFRSHYCEVQTLAPAERQAWAAGGWLAYRSGWLLDGFQIGATYYGSAPVYAPEETDGTMLLAPGQRGYSVLGEAFAALRYERYALLTGYRQIVQEPFINRMDNRMTPNTFEGVTVAGEIGAVHYFAGYLAQIKTRNADQFVPMSVAAGVLNSHSGVGLLDAIIQPAEGLNIKVVEQYGVHTFNTFFAEAEKQWSVGRELELKLGAQLIDQRAIGNALVAPKHDKWIVRNGAMRISMTYRNLTLKAGGSVTTSGSRILTPWGLFPGYLRLAQLAFDNANEKAWTVGAAYDFSRAGVRGLVAFTDVARGVDSVNEVTGAHLPAEAEYDLTFDYRPPPIRALWLRLRGIVNAQEGADHLAWQVRMIANWEIPLL